MKGLAYLFIIFIWFQVVLTVATGLFYTENYRLRRKDSPREFWIAVGTSIGLAVVATIMVLIVAKHL